MAGDYRHIRARGQQADTGPKFTDGAGGAACSLGEQDENVSGIGEELSAEFETMARVGLARKWERVDDDGRGSHTRETDKEIVLGGGWESAVQLAQWQGGEETECV